MGYTFSAMTLTLLVAALIQSDAGKIRWRKDVDTAIQDARTKGVPAMIYFTSAG